MTGEKLDWFRIASHLHIPVEELAARITHREFLGWLDYLDWERDFHSKTDYYFAQLAAEIHRSVVKQPLKIKIKDKLIKFEKEVKDSPSKTIWLSVLDIDKHKLPSKKRKK